MSKKEVSIPYGKGKKEKNMVKILFYDSINPLWER